MNEQWAKAAHDPEFARVLHNCPVTYRALKSGLSIEQAIIVLSDALRKMQVRSINEANVGPFVGQYVFRCKTCGIEHRTQGTVDMVEGFARGLAGMGWRLAFGDCQCGLCVNQTRLAKPPEDPREGVFKCGTFPVKKDEPKEGETWRVLHCGEWKDCTVGERYAEGMSWVKIGSGFLTVKNHDLVKPGESAK